MSKDRESYFKDYASRLADMIDIHVILVGGNRHLDVMEDLLNNTKIEYFTLSRPLTAEPDLINGQVEILKSLSVYHAINVIILQGKDVS